MIFYFTGTGNSLAAAKILARELNEPLISITEAIQKNQYTWQLQPEEKVGFVFPVYYYGLPTIIREFAENLTLTGSSDPYIYAVITCGGGIGAADRQITKVLLKRGLTVRVIFEILTVDNYVLLYDMPSPDAQAAILAAADKRAEQIAGAIKMVNGKPRWIKNRCVHCLGCIHRCPTAAIQYGKGIANRRRFVNPALKTKVAE